MSIISIKKIISGGQSGVDRAALDVALELGIPCGGRCPKGRRAEDGRIADKYPLQETKDDFYQTRTRLNVKSSDATLILFTKNFDKGTRLTEKTVKTMKKPVLTVDLSEENDDNVSKVSAWLEEYKPEMLNIAGPRESSSPGIYDRSLQFLRELFTTGRD